MFDELIPCLPTLPSPYLRLNPTFRWEQSLVYPTPTWEQWKPFSELCHLSSYRWPSTSLQWESHLFFFSLHFFQHALSSPVGVTLSVCFLFQAVFTYWMTSNLFSLGQVALLRHPAVRKKLRIPAHIIHPTSALPPSEGFVESVRKGTART